MEKGATREITFDVPALGAPVEASCSCCASPAETIAGALRRIPGVQRVDVDACCQRVAVGYDPVKATPAMVAGVLEDLGFLGATGPGEPGMPLDWHRRHR